MNFDLRRWDTPNDHPKKYMGGILHNDTRALIRAYVQALIPSIASYKFGSSLELKFCAFFHVYCCTVGDAPHVDLDLPISNFQVAPYCRNLRTLHFAGSCLKIVEHNVFIIEQTFDVVKLRREFRRGWTKTLLQNVRSRMGETPDLGYYAG